MSYSASVDRMVESISENLKQVATRQMNVDGCVASIMFAPRLKGDTIHGLPPGSPAYTIPLDCLPGAPEGWVRSRGSFVVPVVEEVGIWFDWRRGDSYDDNTAVIASIKGMNPLTGMKIEQLRLEHYREKCPKHNKLFLGPNRFCEECEHNWPPQNYISGRVSTLWWDGFRQSDGSVRQFFFTDEDKRDVASAMIGKENTVPAFGFAFFQCKKERVGLSSSRGITTHYAFGNVTGQSVCASTDDNDFHPKSFNTCYSTQCSTKSMLCPKGGNRLDDGPTGETGPIGPKGVDGVDASEGCMNFMAEDEAPRVMKVNRSLSRKSAGGGARAGGASLGDSTVRVLKDTANKDVSVGAGARIAQELELDSLSLDDWHAEPKGLIRLYFVFAEQLEEICQRGGVKKLECKPEGMLVGVPVG